MQMRMTYVGESFRGIGLTNGKTYMVEEANKFCYLVRDDSGEKIFYSKFHPAPFDGSGEGGVWMQA